MDAIKLVIYSANTISTQLVYSVAVDISYSLFNSQQWHLQVRAGQINPLLKLQPAIKANQSSHSSLHLFIIQSTILAAFPFGFLSI